MLYDAIRNNISVFMQNQMEQAVLLKVIYVNKDQWCAYAVMISK